MKAWNLKMKECSFRRPFCPISPFQFVSNNASSCGMECHTKSRSPLADTRCNCGLFSVARSFSVSGSSFLLGHSDSIDMHSFDIKKMSRKRVLRRKMIAVQATSSRDQCVPESLEEAILQARDSALFALGSLEANASSKKKRKGKHKHDSTNVSKSPIGSGFSAVTKRLSIEIPVRDDSKEALLSLAHDFLKALPQDWQKQFTLVTGSKYHVSSSDSDFLSQDRIIKLSTCLEEGVPGGCLMILGPALEDIEALESLVQRYRGPAVIFLNPDWFSQQNITDIEAIVENNELINSFDAVYCFMPIALKMFVFNTQEGAIFRYCGKQNALSTGFSTSENSQMEGSKTPWRILIRKGDAWEPIARMSKRPSATDVEVSFYNASAAESPLTSAAKFIKKVTKR